jgi:S1-C subfamily serine protease
MIRVLTPLFLAVLLYGVPSYCSVMVFDQNSNGGRGLENTLSTGIVSGIRKGERVTLLQTTAPISHGSSGGGLFDADGNLIGVTTLQYNNAQALNFAVSVDHLDLPK